MATQRSAWVLLACAMASAVAATSEAAIPAATNWTRLPGFFCHPGVVGNRLHRNFTGGIEGCIAICASDPSCISIAVTNQLVPALSWCFAPEEDCPNPTGHCPGGCVNFDTYVKPGSDFPYPGRTQWFNLSATLSSHMVLQQAPASAKLWGWGVPGTPLKVTAGAFAMTTTVAADSAWSVTLPPQKAGAVFGTGVITFETVLANASQNLKIVLDDVMYGEVWLCTGQSNMALTLAGLGKGPTGAEPLTSWSGAVTSGAAEIVNASSYPDVRVVQQQTVSLAEPTEHALTISGWSRAGSPGVDMSRFSATCWLFGRRLQAELGLPVGLIENCVGGTAVERWSSADALGKCDQSRGPDKLAVCKTRTEEEDARHYGRFGLDPAEHADDAAAGVNSTLFNGMISPWLGTAVKGAIWYQGESNVACSDVWPYMQGLNCGMNASSCADYYTCQFPAMIADWTAKFSASSPGLPPLTFLFVGLPAYVEDLPSTTYDGKNDRSLPLVRLSQLASTKAAGNIFMTSLIDHGFLQGHDGSIHPMDKTPVGKRLMLAAREHAYGADVISTGPLPLAAALSSSTQITLTFAPDTVGPAGLLLRTAGAVRQVCAAGQAQITGNPHSVVPPSQCGPATGFEVGSGAGTWTAVHSIVIGKAPNALELAFPAAGPSPTKLRYLFSDWPTPTVYDGRSFLGANGELPAPPFQMDVGPQ